MTAWTRYSPPTKAPFHEAPLPPKGSSRSPRERGLFTPTLNDCSSAASLLASSVSSQAIEATRAPLETFIAARSSAGVSTTTRVSTGPNGSAWYRAELLGGSKMATGGT